MRNFITTFFSLFFAAALFGQTAPNFWKQVDYKDILLPEKSETMIMPSEFLSYSLDFNGMVNYLSKAPQEGSNSTFRLQLPMADGTMETFEVWESSILPEELAAKYPEIRTFGGKGLRNPAMTLRFGYGYDAFHAIVLGGSTASAITWYADNQNEYHICFDPARFDQYADQVPELFCGLDQVEELIDPALSPEEPVIKFRGGGEGTQIVRRSYRVAISTTGEYSQMHGGTLQSVLSSIVTAVNTLNTILERETAVRFILIPNEESLIFLDPNSDPFFNSNVGGAIMNQNPQVVNSIIGVNGYDVSQVFTGPCTDVGGVVSGRVCAQGKAAGTTCNFTSNVVSVMLNTGAHEFGHQLSAGHTWNNCPGQEGQFAEGTSWEPGSGSTILSYQGACGPSNISGTNVQYHGGTIGQIWSYTRTGGGTSCGLIGETANHAPEIIWPYSDGFYIPISTPFELEAQATDADGDALTYVWDQINIGPSAPLGQPIGTSPSFRTFDPSNSPKRTFPRLATLLANGSEVTEVLPTYSRNFTFRFLARDNNTSEGTGGVTWEDISFEATASAGPFLVTFPNNSNVVWNAGQEVEVTWDVANTDNNLVKCHAVNIKLSLDGGYTYPHTLAWSTPNDGSEVVFIPNVTTNQARIRVEADNNIFFDISNENFKINSAAGAGYILSMNPQYQQICVPDQAEVELKTGAILNYSSPIEFEIMEGLPIGAEAVFSKNPVNPGESAFLSLNMNQVTDDGLFEIVLRAVADADTVYRSLFFNVVYNNFSALELLEPFDGQSSLGLLPSFTWTDLPHADRYDFQLSISPTFEPGTIISQAFNLTDAFFVPDTGLVESRIYFWRVRPSNECGLADYTGTVAFQTFTTTCTPFVSSDVPKNISKNGLPVVQSIIPIAQVGSISDLNVTQVRGTHDLVKHLEVKIISPSGLEGLLFKDICGNTSVFNLGFNDEAPYEIKCPPSGGQQFKPQEPLAKFIGESTLGNWTLQVTVTDPAGNGGTLQSWKLEFCAAISPNHPFLVNNDTIYVKPLNTRILHNYEIAVEDEDNNGNELQFTVINNTAEGYLSRNGVKLEIGDHFNMTDIHLEKITYTNTNPDAVYDFFTFVVEDGTGGWLGTPKVNIVVDENAVVSAKEIKRENAIFLFPNPANQRLTVNLREPLEGEGLLTVTDLSGRMSLKQNLGNAQQQAQLDLGDFAPGIYFLSVHTASGIFTEKFIVQR